MWSIVRKEGSQLPSFFYTHFFEYGKKKHRCDKLVKVKKDLH
ncbi:hypothetical protein JMA_37420 (plasmid) [Jeotgalibacillus malaysiensis]|uniref:Uncharacterized protein n=1 Tax=Jeotgalibacillus malaysiensis TaxID=1508404 RepID=A0A0B5AS09_9BACL|nr:hypothetical protein JMA_37420 [Jeotgalibacillus malaysiensis]